MLLSVCILGIIVFASVCFYHGFNNNSLLIFSDPAFLMDDSGRLLKANKAFKELQNRAFPAISHNHLFTELTGCSLSDETPWQTVLFPLKKDMEKRVLVRHPLTKKGFLCVLTKDEFTTLKTDILHRLIHDAKSPLSTASMALHNLQFITHQNGTKPDTAGIDEYLLPAQEAVSDTTKRIQNAVLFSRSKHLSAHAVNANDVLEKVQKQLKHSIAIRLDLDNNPFFMMADEAIIGLVVEQLAVIASKITGEASSVTLRSRNDQSNSKKPQNEIHIFTSALSETDSVLSQEKKLNPEQFPKDLRLLLHMVLILLKQYQAQIYGDFNPDTGSYFKLVFTPLKD